MERRTGRRSNFSQSRTKKNCYGAGVKNFAYYAIFFLPFFSREGWRWREGEGRLAKAPKPQVVVTIKEEEGMKKKGGKVITSRRFLPTMLTDSFLAEFLGFAA